METNTESYHTSQDTGQESRAVRSLRLGCNTLEAIKGRDVIGDIDVENPLLGIVALGLVLVPIFIARGKDHA
jgi:hypothetical protein